jgi:hypothetical protein
MTYQHLFAPVGLALCSALVAASSLHAQPLNKASGLSAPSVTSSVASANNAAQPGDSLQIKGHSYPKTIQLDGSTLHLNGAGVRYKVIVPVYTAALYSSKPVKSEQEFMAAPGAKRLILTMLRRVDSNELGYMFAKAMKLNIDPKDMVTALPGLARMGQVFADAKAVNPGDTIIMDWMGKGQNTVISIRNQQQGEPFAEAAFHRALMGVWLGEHAADYQLKDALLGNSSKKTAF